MNTKIETKKKQKKNKKEKKNKEKDQTKKRKRSNSDLLKEDLTGRDGDRGDGEAVVVKCNNRMDDGIGDSGDGMMTMTKKQKNNIIEHDNTNNNNIDKSDNVFQQQSSIVCENKKKRKEDKKKSKQKKRKKGKQEDEEDAPLVADIDNAERLVASSAIEFYDDSLKEKVKKKKKETPDIVLLPTKEEKQQQQIINQLMQQKQKNHSLTLLLFYQYVEPKWDQSTYDYMLSTLQNIGTDLKLTGRMRVAQEGLNCTLTGSHESIVEYCNTLRRLKPPTSKTAPASIPKTASSSDETQQPPEFPFENTEFKLTTDLPEAQRFPNLKVLKVVELVHYGLEGKKAPPIQKYHGTHLEPIDYHKKIAEPNTVIIDVRNHYEAAIGRFVPPQEEQQQEEGASQKKSYTNTDSNNGSNDLSPPKWLDPKMRKSTEFPQWLDRPETKEEMKGKQVLMVR